MGTQRNNSLDVHRWFLSSMLVLVLVLPALSLDSLLCYYCPLQHKAESCNMTSQCPPGQRCSRSRGHYGSVHILSAQGCVDAQLCGSHEMASYWGVRYNVSHTCCCTDKCNSWPKTDARLKTLLGMIKGKMNVANITDALRDELWDSCANDTSLMRITSPTTAPQRSL